MSLVWCGQPPTAGMPQPRDNGTGRYATWQSAKACARTPARADGEMQSPAAEGGVNAVLTMRKGCAVGTVATRRSQSRLAEGPLRCASALTAQCQASMQQRRCTVAASPPTRQHDETHQRGRGLQVSASPTAPSAKAAAPQRTASAMAADGARAQLQPQCAASAAKTCAFPCITKCASASKSPQKCTNSDGAKNSCAERTVAHSAPHRHS